MLGECVSESKHPLGVSFMGWEVSAGAGDHLGVPASHMGGGLASSPPANRYRQEQEQQGLRDRPPPRAAPVILFLSKNNRKIWL